jgi:hypothetical protein
MSTHPVQHMNLYRINQRTSLQDTTSYSLDKGLHHLGNIGSDLFVSETVCEFRKTGLSHQSAMEITSSRFESRAVLLSNEGDSAIPVNFQEYINDTF